MNYNKLIKTIKRFPQLPGCYLMKNNQGKIIYIGKAKDLQKRVLSYFNKDVDKKTLVLLNNVHDIEYIVTSTEMEALILESELIKKHQPKFNIKLKANNHYPYLVITKEKFPRLLLVHNKKIDGEYFGPYPDSYFRRILVDTLRNTFKIRTCSSRLPKRVCLQYHIKRCWGPCENKITEETYNDNINKIRSILRGKVNKLIDELKIKMNQHINNMNYEKALILRDNINTLYQLKELKDFYLRSKFTQDIINYYQDNNKNKILITVFRMNKGLLLDREDFYFDKDIFVLDKFIQYYYFDKTVPYEIIIPQSLSPLIIEYLKAKRQSNLKITVPKKGNEKKLLDLVYKNIKLKYLNSIPLELEELQKILLLEDPIITIDCFDISNLKNEAIVGAVVRYSLNKFDKKYYKKFKIKTIDKQDDFKAMGEVVYRNYARLQKEHKRMPDLILIDGGKGQLNSAKTKLYELGIRQIPIISLAKKEEVIFVPWLSKKIRLNKKSKALLLLQKIRNETHRFVISYNRYLRNIKNKS